MDFYDRDDEIRELHRLRTLAFGQRSRLTVVTGRRRIGKTSLIVKACEGTPTVYLFVSRDNETVLVRRFAEEIRSSIKVFIPDEILSFRTLFQMLMEAGKTRKFNLIIDEFQDFSYVNPAIFSHIQDVWDRLRQETHVNFIVSGSVYSMMNRIFENSKEPLFGRRDALLRISPFRTDVLKQILADYHPDYSPEDLLALYAFTGGVPKYVELFIDDGICSQEAMIPYMIKEGSQFVTEGKNLLIEEFGKDYGTYFSILGCISSGINTQAEIESAMGNVSIGGNLKRLVEDYALISRVRPFASKERTKAVRYEISDNFLRMWFKYVRRNQSIVEIGNWNLLRKIISDDYTTFTGDILERYFRQKMMESMKYRAIGNWWDPRHKENQCEIDIIAITADDRTAEIYEVKRNPDKYRKALLEQKVEYLCAKVKELNKYDIRLSCLSMKDM